jgi:uncharacterized protein YyaL (SSP411 family)
MAHESFEDEAVAAILNRNFVPVKVDREERPDVDRIYMLFVQATTGSGGWPMSVWLTPDLKPFFGGTYFPPDSRYGRPGFRDLLEHLARAWQQERQKIEASGVSVLDQLRNIVASGQKAIAPDRELFQSAFQQFRRMFDSRWGGFGSAPKFPRPVVLNYLLRYYTAEKDAEALEMVTETLLHMAAGGMHDQLGGGVHRYSVDERWFVPHFEKMLYDQAQLAIAALEAYQASGDPRFARIAEDIFSYVLRDLADDGGGFYSAEDADSPDPDRPGHTREGAFYVWTKAEIIGLLDAGTGDLFLRRYGIEEHGNVEHDPQGEFTGRNILYEARTEEEVARDFNLELAEAARLLANARQTLFDARSKRPRPHLDNKVLTSWNALMISAFAKGYTVTGNAEYKNAGLRAASFIISTMYCRDSGRLLRRYCDGEAGVPAFLDDYAFLAQALLDLFECTFEFSYLEIALDLAMRGFAQFEDSENGGFFSTAGNSDDLLLRMKDDYDGAEPSGNSVATDVLERLAHLTGAKELQARAERSLQSFAPKLKAQPTIAPQMLVAISRSFAEPAQVILRCADVDNEVEALVRQYSREFAPNRVVLAVSDHLAAQLSRLAPFLSGLERKGRITIYECRNFTCQLPRVIQ